MPSPAARRLMNCCAAVSAFGHGSRPPAEEGVAAHRGTDNGADDHARRLAHGQPAYGTGRAHALSERVYRLIGRRGAEDVAQKPPDLRPCAFASYYRRFEVRAPREADVKTLKTEEVDGRRFRDINHARRSIGLFIDTVYNTERLHSALGYCSPSEFESNFALARNA
jgi:hypothetical protein